jgi:hypothetical protein
MLADLTQAPVSVGGKLEMMRVRATDPRPCPKCGKIYRSAHTLRTHMEDKHTICPGYRCVLCGTVAKSRNSLHSHMSRQHRGISTKARVCSVKRFLPRVISDDGMRITQSSHEGSDTVYWKVTFNFWQFFGWWQQLCFFVSFILANCTSICFYLFLQTCYEAIASMSRRLPPLVWVFGLVLGFHWVIQIGLAVVAWVFCDKACFSLV